MKQFSLPGFEEEKSAVGSRQSAVANVKPQAACERQSPNLPLSSSPPLPVSSLAGQTVWAIDAHSLIYQVFHALPEMTSPTGEPVGAVFGFTRDLLHLLEEKKPDFLFCAFDLPGKTFRHALYQAYKEQRAEMPDELKPQIPAICRMLIAMGIPALACEGFEADDILATVAHAADQLGARCFLVSNDKDCRQLIADRVSVFQIRKDEVFDRDALRTEWGIAPEQVVDYQSLVGDSVDNVPGVPLVGPKLARQLLGQFGTLEGILAHIGEVPGEKRRENLRQFGDQALLSRRLVRLSAEVPIAIDWAAGRTGRIDLGAALDLCREFGFRSIGQRLTALAGR
jgi:DNA polymerase I